MCTCTSGTAMYRDFVEYYIGHKAYRGFLYLEHTYNNKVANTFVTLLSEERDQIKDSPSFQGKIIIVTVISYQIRS